MTTLTNAISGTAVVKDAAGNDVTAQFTVKTENGTLEITPAAITIKADNKEKVYDNDPTSDPALTATVTGVPENGTAPVYSLSRVEGQDVDVYAVTVTAEAASNPNYTVTVEGGTFKITPTTITIKADAKTKVYDNDESTDPALTATVTGVPENGVAPTYRLSREAGQDVDEYAITVTAEAESNPNYTVSVEGGTFKITPAAITIKADDKTKAYDNDENTDPELTATVTGVPTNGTAPVYSLSRAEGQDVNEYAITVTAEAASNPNYTVTVEDGTFKITPAAITITADDKTKVYDNDGSTDPELTATVKGVPAKGTAPVYSLSREEGQNVNEYAITVTAEAASNPNYTVTVEDGTFKITPAAITIKADDKTKTYGDADPELTATVNGAVEGDEIKYTLSREAGENVNEYAITVTAGENPNYTVKVEDGTFAIRPKAVTITVDAKTKEFGEEDPELTATVTGAVGDDEIQYTLTREPGEDVGEYKITALVENDANPNYTVTVEGNAFVITAPTAYTLTVRYWYDTVDGRTAAKTFVKVYEAGSAYNVASPSITGYTPDRTRVTGTLTQDRVEDVIYTLNAYTLTVRYIFEDGSQAAPTYTDTLYYSADYSIASPVIDGYTVSNRRISGTMPARNVERTVVYVADGTRIANVVIEDFDTPLGLRNLTLNTGEAIE